VMKRVLHGMPGNVKRSFRKNGGGKRRHRVQLHPSLRSWDSPTAEADHCRLETSVPSFLSQPLHQLYFPFLYFQFRGFPSASHSTACAIRRARVASCLASVTHSTYSRLWLGLNASNASCALALAASALRKSAGIGRAFFGFTGARGAFTPVAFSATARFT